MTRLTLCATVLVGLIVWAGLIGLIVMPCYVEHRANGYSLWTSLVACGG